MTRFDLIIFDICRDGHRRDYFRVLRRVLGGRVIWGSIKNRWRVLLLARKLVCSTCDDYLPSFFVLAILRALSGRPTIGLSVRSETIFQRFGMVQKIKGGMLKLLKRVPNIDVVTFMPYWVEPRLERYTAGWMYDLQYWDIPWLDLSSSESMTHLDDEVSSKASGRRIVATVGHQRRVKGIEYFMSLYDQAAVREQFLFVCIGPNWDIDKALVERFVQAGGMFIDKHLRDDEVLCVYKWADIIWACYRPDYDQSSGVFGRAVQLQKPTVVRKGSYLATLQAGLGQTGFALPYDRPNEAAAILIATASYKPKSDFEIGVDRSAGFLCSRLGVERPTKRAVMSICAEEECSVSIASRK